MLTLAARDRAIARRYLAGDTLAEVGCRYNLTRERVRQVLAARGVARRERGPVLERRRPLALELATSLYRAGRSCESAATRAGISPAALRRRLQATGQYRPYRPELPVHGTLARYRRGCHCRRCRAANVSYCRPYLLRYRRRAAARRAA